MKLDVLLRGLTNAYHLDFSRLVDRGLCVLPFLLFGDGRLLKRDLLRDTHAHHDL